jgi:hypothetical protein
MKRRKLSTRCLAIESLESRYLMAAITSSSFYAGDAGPTVPEERSGTVAAAETAGPTAANVSLAGSVLRVDGTGKDDIIEIMRNAVKPKKLIVDCNGSSAEYDAAKISKIIVNGFKGNDDIRNRTNIPCELHGGAGKDTLEGGTGDDLLFGEGKNDKLYGGAGSDQLDGGAGDDYLQGDTGRDRYMGGEGYDNYFDTDQFNPHLPSVGGATFDDVKQGQSDTCSINAVMGALAKRNPKFFESTITELSSYPSQDGGFVTLFKVATPGNKAKYGSTAFDGCWSDGDSQPRIDAAGYLTGDYWNVLVQRVFLSNYGVKWSDKPDTWDDRWEAKQQQVPWRLTMNAIKDLTGRGALCATNKEFSFEHMSWLLNTEKSFIIAEMPAATGQSMKHAVAVTAVDLAKKTVTLWNPVGTPGQNGPNSGLMTISFDQFKKEFDQIWYPWPQNPYDPE